jgi:membrane-associated phospholipid phosphatase
LTKSQRLSGEILWPLLGIALVAVACAHPLWKIRSAQLTGDFLSHTFYLTFNIVGAGLMLWRAFRGGLKPLYWWPAIAALFTFLCVEGLKQATRLPRPDGEPTGFPSGHTTLSFSVAGLLTQIHPRLAPLWYGAAISIGWSRVEGHAHFPYQVVTGAVIGTAISWTIGRLLPGVDRRIKPTNLRQ